MKQAKGLGRLQIEGILIILGGMYLIVVSILIW